MSDERMARGSAKAERGGFGTTYGVPVPDRMFVWACSDSSPTGRVIRNEWLNPFGGGSR